MGGIFGIIGEGFASDQRTRCLHTLASAMRVRGAAPAFWQSGHAGLGAVALDYETGLSVVTSPDQSVVAVCEGEVYNVPALSAGLKCAPPAGSSLRGFEVVPHLYQELGCDFPRAMNGIFGIALWDRRHERLVLVRDHLGAHSVFYHVHGSVVTFATSIHAAAPLDHVQLEVDVDSLDRYLASLAVSPPSTIYRGVCAVPPGHAVVFERGKRREHAYWRLDAATEDYTRPAEDFAEELRHLFQDAVALRVQAGGNCGVLASGGVDTSSIVAALFATGSVQRMPAFSIAFAEQDYSDGWLQKVVYERYPVDARQLVVGPSEFAENLRHGSEFLDTPINDTAYAGMYAAFRHAAQHGCQVVFEGEGSDEIFCTTHSLGELSLQKYLRIPGIIRRALLRPFVSRFDTGSSIRDRVVRMLARLGMSDIERRCTWIPGFPQRKRKRLLGGAVRTSADVYEAARRYYAGVRLRDPINIYQYGLTRLFLADDLLYKNERMAAGAGVVNRTPFADYRLVEAAFRIPAVHKIARPSAASDGTKLIFKKAMRGLVPDEILDRKKRRGFSQPTAVWYRGELGGFVRDHLLDPRARVYDWLDRDEVRAVCSDFFRGEAANDYYVNSLLILELWMRGHGV